METGLGDQVSLELGALIVAVASSALMLGLFLLMGREPKRSAFEVVVTGVVVGVAYYLGLRLGA